MLHRDESIVHVLHAERRGLYGHGPERRVLAGREGGRGIRRALGHAFVRLGTRLAAEPARPAQGRPRVPSSA
jgi:hypothetical protein